MSQDVGPVHLVRLGAVTVSEHGIIAEGFGLEGGTGRDMALMACVWAINRLQAELLRDAENPGTVLCHACNYSLGATWP